MPPFPSMGYAIDFILVALRFSFALPFFHYLSMKSAGIFSLC